MSARPLTRRGAATLVAGVGCMIAANALAAPILLYVGVLFMLLPFAAAIAVRAPRRTGEVTRRISTDLLGVGEQSQVAVRFELRSLRLPHGVWHDTLPPQVSGDASGEFPTENGSRMGYAITGVRRGIWPIGPLTLRTVDPFGLAQREQRFGDTRTVTVVPEVVPLPPLETSMGSAGGVSRSAADRLGQGSDNLSPRLYVSGDSMRRIHWRATAHRGELMVRQEEEESSPDALVVLDRSAVRWPRKDDEPDPGFETAVSACASIALHLLHDGYSVDVTDSAGRMLGTLRGREDDRESLLVALAAVSAQGEQRDLTGVLGGAPPGPLVLITGRVDEEDAALLRHGGATAPILLAVAPLPGALAAARAHGWSAAPLEDDIAASWQLALPERNAGRYASG